VSKISGIEEKRRIDNESQRRAAVRAQFLELLQPLKQGFSSGKARKSITVTEEQSDRMLDSIALSFSHNGFHETGSWSLFPGEWAFFLC